MAMVKVKRRDRGSSLFGSLMLLVWGMTAAIFFVGVCNPHLPCFSNIKTMLAFQLVCGLVGGLIAVITIKNIISACRAHAEGLLEVGRLPTDSKAGAKNVATTSLIVATKLVALVSAFFATVGCFSLCLNSEMGVMHLDRIGSIAMMVTGIVFAAVAIIAPQLILSFAASDCGKVEEMAGVQLKQATLILACADPVSATVFACCTPGTRPVTLNA